MKKKKSLYILLPITLLVWGAIILKILFNFSGNEEVSPIEGEKTKIASVSENINGQFKLFLDYTDPFLGRKKTSDSDHSTKSFNEVKAGIIKTLQNWPDIKYFGVVKNIQTGSRKVNLSIGEKMFLLKEKDKVENLRLEKIYRDSVVVSMNYERKTFCKTGSKQ